MKMQIVIAILSLLFVLSANAAFAQSTFSMSISRHVDTDALSQSQIEKILDDASKILQKPGQVSTGDDDFVCNVAFALKGPIGTFGGSPSVSASVDQNNIASVHQVDSDRADVDFRVKVVNEIKFCRPGLSGITFFGCSFSPPDFRSMIIIHPNRQHRDENNLLISNFPNHLLLAHEFGHLTGIGHRHSTDALMTSCPLHRLPARVKVSKDDCSCLRGGPKTCTLPAALGCNN